MGLLNSEDFLPLPINTKLKNLKIKDFYDLWELRRRLEKGKKKNLTHLMEFQGNFNKRRATGYFFYCLSLRKSFVRLHLKCQMMTTAE